MSNISTVSVRLFAFLALIVISANAFDLQVQIIQPNAVIDAKPILNYCEVQFTLNGNVQAYDSTIMWWSSLSSGFGFLNCNDGNTVTGSGPYNMCKSGNGDPTGQNVTIKTRSLAFDNIRIFNANGFNNPAGMDVGLRTVGATIRIVDMEEDQKVIWQSRISRCTTFQCLS